VENIKWWFLPEHGQWPDHTGVVGMKHALIPLPAAARIIGVFADCIQQCLQHAQRPGFGVLRHEQDMTNPFLAHLVDKLGEARRFGQVQRGIRFAAMAVPARYQKLVAAGRQVRDRVAPNAGGVTMYANPENAWTVSPEVESYAVAVDEIVTNRTMAATKTVKTVEAARQFGWATAAVSFLELYEQLKRLETDAHALPVPAFCSTPARGLQAALMRATAHLAKRGFQLWSRLTPEADSLRTSKTAYQPPVTSEIEISDPEGTGLTSPPYGGHFCHQ